MAERHRDLDLVQISAWIKPLGSHLVSKTIILNAPSEVREYLASDGLHLPPSVMTKDTNDTQWECDVEEDSDSDTEENVVDIPAEFVELLDSTIKDLGGSVAPKLNWSAPRDATWISPTGDMKCCSVVDVLTLCKASDYCSHDLTESLLPNQPLKLVLRQWVELNPAMEFRCFLKNGKLRAACQRDTQYYEFLEPLRSNIWKALTVLASHVSDHFSRDVVFDAYVPEPFVRARLIDINLWDEGTDSIFINWEDLEKSPGTGTESELYLLGKEDSTRSFSCKPHSSNHVPHDLVDMDHSSLLDLASRLREFRDLQVKEDAKSD